MLKNLRLAKKLAIGFGAVLVVTAASSGFLFTQITSLATVETINSSSDNAELVVQRMNGDIASTRAAVLKFILTNDPVDEKATSANLKKFDDDAAELRGTLTQDIPELLPSLVAVEAAVKRWADTAVTAELQFASDPTTVLDAIAVVKAKTTQQSYEKVFSTSSELFKRVHAWSDSYAKHAEHAMWLMEVIVAASGILCLFVGLLAAWLITRSIARPINAMTVAMKSLARGDNSITIPAADQTDEIGEMAQTVQVFKDAAIEKLRLEGEASQARRTAEEERVRHADAQIERARQQSEVVEGLAAALSKLAAGDLVQRLDNPFAGEYEGLRADFNGAIAQMEATMQEILTNAGAIRSGTGEIAMASDDLSRRTEQQAASLEETAAALDEITATVKKTAESAEHARKAVGAARSDAEHSGHVVARAVAAMGNIESSSRQIGQIIGVIDEIAFQTNLLALNAGVEAARAGDAGRGFAVVASEVRSLAQRSAEAAKEIKTLIMTSDNQVKEGVRLVSETGDALNRIVNHVVEITEVVGEIAGSAHEQAGGLAQVNTAVNQMDQVTQQNAAMVEESTAAAHGLTQETDQLGQLIGRFQVTQPTADQAIVANAAARKASLKVVSAHNKPAPSQPAPAVPRAAQTGPMGGRSSNFSLTKRQNGPS
ncbi:methyl-accepting chemotaxis protein [Acidisphaera sp. L21]|uniref:methyl-accepting chemotaxis protein n=1 Tax=Acidisphaera sp. L21 TaxID=1641851 RepID=UPI00131D9661|nr:methyl-accepting chemotaxis protein [Acidisphaera sp. L21]